MLESTVNTLLIILGVLMAGAYLVFLLALLRAARRSTPAWEACEEADVSARAATPAGMQKFAPVGNASEPDLAVEAVLGVRGKRAV